MKITDLLSIDTILLSAASDTKSDILDELANKLNKAGKLNDIDAFRKAIDKREKESTTGIGEGIAIPHAKTSAVKTPAIAFARSEQGIDYDSLDGQPAHLFFMIAASEGADNAHLETLSQLSTYLLKKEFREKLMKAENPEEIINLFENQDDSGEDAPASKEDKAVKKEKILAVTGCPTGIAHTYMAADSLKEKAKEMGYDIKVQTNGSTGVKNRLTEDDIAEAAGIIVAADTKVDMEPFIGKPVVEVPVAEALRDPESLISRVINGEADVYNGSASSHQQAVKEDKEEKKSKQPAFYKHLMNGVSYMLPFVVGGGIIIALSLLFGIHAAEKGSPYYNPIAHALNVIGSAHAMALMVPILAGYIAYSIADRPGFAPGAVGGFLASTGQAGFLGGLIAGFLAGYIVILIKRIFRKLPESLEGLKPVLIYPFFGILITGLIMVFAINPPVKFIMDTLTDWLGSMGTANKVLLGIILAGMMAIDMGGPFNKAAYTFGLAMIAAHNYAPQAAILAGGMVPPLGLALATTLFKKKFTKSERNAGKTAYALGACFITEGAIPFAAADPARVIPSCVIGSAVAGGLAMFFNIGLRAPHGGIFVIPFVDGSAWLYILSIVIGAVVTALMIGALKKPVES
ncbi:PTS system fructose-specific IIC component [Scopulibacillus daqui]|uniref:PTS system fructose-specific IIC component n=1 Tax=Scopulibacillus daqui TaxID=1469162 RepID=A0ABS2Q312_9BACL|nr:PTS system fructose-specific IIC component [Scopulibacillus daqui]